MSTRLLSFIKVLKAMKKTIFLIGFLSLLLAPYKFVFACRCVQPGAPKEELQTATAVFSGTVVDIDKKKVSVGQGFFEDSYTATFDVEMAWKGVSKKTITVNAGIQGGMCGYPFEEKESYIVYAHGADENGLLTSLCTRTNKLIYAYEDLKELGEGQAELVQNTVPELPAHIQFTSATCG
ncbi:MAG: hypothetical protein UW39_C0017G0011 [Parcubacteria group bacterium GW2011_GWC2_44_17]|uniref:Uncharacterized protein n=1 Tax=Candidatus Jacksonbacteria bacterium RIFCSPLOWO2_02_FULL_44_20 TaxID=1798460 RepID=A0A1G2A982_9BACT|nr:MAG: hypothetical protein UW39_C0017G0011 [Parcubacteria group bacterium GW2011_GWC2_44_17]OGY70060.1 MAG: hypothetical protein A3C00_00210 [Candidatus Jacksonbacteria bacterium RIFCSPHIGHO2_02_FULL_44_25]OGY72506.1 MAG: hypothetical protein A3E05_03020 [Candidatus Jacksonbacteria bacterium RIFCSPHIGHO2_12_FULL_44_12]OGY73463.1 MAG: hypothetical protein A3H61_04925 [Candidatus Jacksonbacteria bacterium RIFCSPLOWO2_02_FULL_44_20]OGY74053.1 MAG: hypothetical protein A3H07_04810 [Candidatus Jac